MGSINSSYADLISFNVIIHSLLWLLNYKSLFIVPSSFYFFQKKKKIAACNSLKVVYQITRLNSYSPYYLQYSYLNVSYENLVMHLDNIPSLLAFFILIIFTELTTCESCWVA